MNIFPFYDDINFDFLIIFNEYIFQYDIMEYIIRKYDYFQPN